MFPVLFVQHDVILDQHIALHEDVVIAGEDGVQDVAEDRGDGPGGKRCGAADLEGQATGEAQTGHQITAAIIRFLVREVDLILDDFSRHRQIIP